MRVLTVRPDAASDTLLSDLTGDAKFGPHRPFQCIRKFAATSVRVTKNRPRDIVALGGATRTSQAPARTDISFAVTQNRDNFV